MKIFRNIVAIIIGWAVGSFINMSLIELGGIAFPIEGTDSNDLDAYAAIIGTLDPEYFIFPFLAHALGTLAGGFAAYLIAAAHKMKFSLTVGLLFFLSGVTINYILPGPVWFAVLDLVIAYFPMAYLGGVIGSRFKKAR